MKQNKSLALLICYYGRFPWYFDYFIHSCKYNPTVDFLIVTDIAWLKPLPANVKLLNMSLNEVKLLATEKLGFEVSLTADYAYKLSEFKPTYGLVFSHILSGYDFWGHIDIDVIFGNIREFITDDLLENYDLISVRPDWIPGCFLLFKNTPKMNTLFLHSKDYKRVFTSKEYHNFDETNFAHNQFKSGKTYREVNTEIESMMHVVQKMVDQNYIKPFFDFFMIEGMSGKLKWENGRMFYRNKYEVLLYHLIYFKNLPPPKLKRDTLPDKFTLSKSKIYHYTKPVLNEL